MLDVLVSLGCLSLQVVVPYIKVKLDRVYSKLQEIDDATPLTWWRGCGLRQVAAVMFFRVYPYLKAGFEVCAITQFFLQRERERVCLVCLFLSVF